MTAVDKENGKLIETVGTESQQEPVLNAYP